jgi:UDP-glucose 4-epimerase
MLGSHIVDRLAAEGAQVVATDVNEPVGGYGWTASGVDFRRADITTDEISALVSEADHVVHVAAMLPSPGIDRRRALFDVNVAATHRLFEAAAERGANVVLASSGSVYGASRPVHRGRPEPAFDEGDVSDDLDFYGMSKRVDELYAATFGRESGMRWNALRCGVLYGPRLRMGLSTRFLLSVLDEADSGRVPRVDGDPDAGLDWVAVEAAAECFAAAAWGNAPSGALNVSTGVATRLEDVLRTLLQVAGADVEIEWTAVAPTGGYSGARYYEPGRTREALGVALEADLEEGLRRFVEWRRSVRGRDLA